MPYAPKWEQQEREREEISINYINRLVISVKKELNDFIITWRIYDFKD
jgi:hypothetical protein